MNLIEKIRSGEDGIVVMGNHPRILQSILDFDYACGKKEPSILACITSNRKSIKFFFGKNPNVFKSIIGMVTVFEIVIPCMLQFYFLFCATRKY